MLRVKKFSWHAGDKEAKITYSIERDGSSEKHQMECPDKPMPELLEALQGLEYDALKELEVVRVGDRSFYEAMDLALHEGRSEEFREELSRGGASEAIAVVRSVSFSWGCDILGASICLLIEMRNSDAPLVVNTPHKPSQQYSDGGQAHLLPEKLVDKLRALHGLIELYIEGTRERKQTDLFEDAPKDEPTISINGGPSHTLSTVKKAIAIVKGEARA